MLFKNLDHLNIGSDAVVTVARFGLVFYWLRYIIAPVMWFVIAVVVSLYLNMDRPTHWTDTPASAYEYLSNTEAGQRNVAQWNRDWCYLGFKYNYHKQLENINRCAPTPTMTVDEIVGVMFSN